jgi:hypothetical protein
MKERLWAARVTFLLGTSTSSGKGSDWVTNLWRRHSALSLACGIQATRLGDGIPWTILCLPGARNSQGVWPTLLRSHGDDAQQPYELHD